MVVRSMMRRRAAVLGAALALDAAFGELPNRWHPVARFGQAAGWLDRQLTRRGRRDTAAAGLIFTGLAAGSAALAGATLGRRLRSRGLAGLAAEAALLKQALALRALFEHADAVRRGLEREDLEGARAAASRMVSRDTRGLPGDLVASAAIESVAENLSDSVIAPAAWYLAGGLAAAYVYRAVNTLDAMAGYRSRGRFGMVPARLDDALNLAPARLTAAAVLAVRPRALVRWRSLAKDARSTASPNAGWPMAAAAHALGVRLEKRGHHVLNGAGRRPGHGDIGRALGVAAAAAVLAYAAALAGSLGAGR